MTNSATLTTMRPLADLVLIKKLEVESKTAFGIIIPDSAKEKPQQGEVLAVGPGKYDQSGKRQEMELKVGDKVLFGKYSGTEIKLEGVHCLLLPERDIMAVFLS